MSLKYRNFRNSNELERQLAFIEKIPLEEHFDKQIEI